MPDLSPFLFVFFCWVPLLKSTTDKLVPTYYNLAKLEDLGVLVFGEVKS